MVKPFQKFLLVSDIDGTLANSEHRVSRKNKEAIAYFVAQGGHFAVATGRTQKNVLPYMEGLEINAPCILYNGGALYSWQEQRFLKSRHMESADVADFLKHCMVAFPQMCIEVFTQEQLYIITDPANVDEHMEREKQEFVYGALEEILDKTWIKIILCDRHENLLASRERLAEFQLEDKTHHFFSADIYLEIVAKDVSKGDMLRELVSIQGFQDKIVIAAGDFQNDLEMLQFAHCGVAPANGQEYVKKVADVVAVSNDEDLLYNIIYCVIPTRFNLPMAK